MKKKKFFFSFRAVFHFFGRSFARNGGSEVFRGSGEGVENKNLSNFKKKVLSAFFRHYG